MKFASGLVDAVVLAVLTGLALSCVVGCAGVRMENVARSLQLAAEQRAEDCRNGAPLGPAYLKSE